MDTEKQNEDRYHPIFFKRDQLRPSRAGTKQELQSPGKQARVSVLSRARCRDARPRPACRQVRSGTIIADPA